MIGALCSFEISMNLIIKARPDDFKVEENAQLPLVSAGRFTVYHLEKSGWNTLDAIKEISKDLKIPSRLFSYGGKKDRHAHTTQFIAIENPRIKDYNKGSLRLAFAGFMDRPMGPDLIVSNRFEIVMRRMSSQLIDHLSREVKWVNSNGFVNYFDDQRFGSYDEDQGFLAEKLLLGHFNGAVKILLTAVYSGDPASEKRRKTYFREHWKDWKACLSKAETELERFSFVELQKGEKSALAVLDRAPKEDLSMYFSAFQSFLWNEVARAYIREMVKDDLIPLKGVVGEYLFYRKISSDLLRMLSSIMIPTASHNTKMPDERLAKIYADVLRARSIEKPMFNRLKVRRAFFKTTDRPLIVVPQNFSADVLEDEIYRNEKKAILRFILPRGSYATMLIKRLTA